MHVGCVYLTNTIVIIYKLDSRQRLITPGSYKKACYAKIDNVEIPNQIHQHMQYILYDAKKYILESRIYVYGKLDYFARANILAGITRMVSYIFGSIVPSCSRLAG